ncbi:hypothetical protein CCR75_003852 [Bremia lactucae]|uniref:Uncharacterized protein n=1 Tax=Bremia lactucae TaxID=4779 RepID=A0A976ILF9_BRELC|nr:hypothetical protein CCR75_003852 [Bremia lactucae]
MVMLPRVLASLALLLGTTRSYDINVYNQCSGDLPLVHVRPGNVNTEWVASGGSTVKTIDPFSPSHVFKWGADAQATLAEFSGGMNKIWLDISIIPTGPKSGPEYCPTLLACKDLTGGVGFNKPMQITPSQVDGHRCVELTCLNDGCLDAYHFPKDDNKTHTCPLSTNFDLTFCPGGSGDAKTAPPSYVAPPPAPTSSPSQAPTEAPTQAPTSPPTDAPTSPPTTQAPAPVKDESPAQEQPPPNEFVPTTEEPQSPEQVQLPSPETQTTQLDPEPFKTSLGSKDEPSNPPTPGSLDGNVPQSRKVGFMQPVYRSSNEQQSLTKSGLSQQIGGTPASDPNNVQQINTQSEQSNSGSTTIVVASLGGMAGMVAAAAIFAVRKKKKALDALESKTPVTGVPDCVLTGMRTPRDNISVL